MSKIKTSTLFPEGGSDKRIIASINQIGNTKPIGVRPSTGEPLYRGTINGVGITLLPFLFFVYHNNDLIKLVLISVADPINPSFNRENFTAALNKITGQHGEIAQAELNRRLAPVKGNRSAIEAVLREWAIVCQNRGK